MGKIGRKDTNLCYEMQHFFNMDFLLYILQKFSILHSYSFKSFGGKHVSELKFRSIVIFYVILNKNTLQFLTFYLKYNKGLCQN